MLIVKQHITAPGCLQRQRPPDSVEDLVWIVVFDDLQELHHVDSPLASFVVRYE